MDWRRTIKTSNRGKYGDKRREPKININNDIKFPEVRLITNDGSQKDIVTIEEALRTSEALGLDLVVISETAKPPVCKIMDYGKYKFEKDKKDKEARKKQRASIIEVKEIKFHVNIDDHDYNTKIKKIRKFIEANNKVKVVLVFRGREMVFKNAALFDRIFDDLKDIALWESTPRLFGRLQSGILQHINMEKKK